MDLERSSFKCDKARFGGFEFGLAARLAAAPKEGLIALMRRSVSRGTGVLGGRGVFGHGELPGVGRVFVKQYTRGGAFGWFVNRSYLHLGKTRGEKECESLAAVRAAGVSAPEPLGYAVRGTFICRAWLFTAFIEDTVSLAELSLRDEDRAGAALRELVGQVTLLVKHSIRHVDLHPGNVLVGASGKVYLLDFDKAGRFDGTGGQLRDFYLRRWRRAIIKHQLPDYLTEIMSLGLRQHEEGARSAYT